MSAAGYISESRLWERLVEMAAIGAVGDTGVNRQAFSAEDNRARALLAAWADELGMAAFIDPIGNLFFRYEPRGATGDPVVTGSHADSQPSGGRFDGIYGVLAAFEVIEAIRESGLATARPLEVVVWSNEEGSRFAPGAMGSMVFTGFKAPQDFFEARDADGHRLCDELKTSLAATPRATPRETGLPFWAYIEAHVEQGPVLEDNGCEIGVVTGIQGCRWFDFEVIGQARHAGSTPVSARRDAFQGAHRIISALNKHFFDPEDITRFTVGRFELQPNSPNTVAERAFFTVDLRHPDAAVLAALGDELANLAAPAAGPCEVRVRESLNCAPVQFPAKVVDAVDRAATENGLSRMPLVSGAFHDAMFLASHCPTGMVFVPSRGGISHHPDEYTEPGQLADGARVLCDAVLKLSET